MGDARYALIGGRAYIDGRLEETNIIISGERIEKCAKPNEPLPEMRKYDLGGMAILPGLIDAHVHLVAGTQATDTRLAVRAAKDAAAMARAGITTVRDLGGMRHIDLEIRNAIKDGRIPGPRMLCCGNPLVMTGGHCHMFFGGVDGVVQAVKAVRSEAYAKVDFLKVFCSGGVLEEEENESALQFSDDEFDAIMKEAAMLGIPVAVHAHPPEAIKRAVRLGARTIEHASYIDSECIELLASRDVYLLPTFLVYKILSEHPEVASLHRRAKTVYEAKFAPFKSAVEAGVAWGVGTDYAARFNEPNDLIREIEILVKEVGLTPTEVISAATETNANIVGLGSQIGRIKPGYLADLAVVNGDPTADISQLREVSMVIQNGEITRLSTENGVGQM